MTESGRVVGDHITNGAISLKTSQSRKALEQISGMEIDRLVAHSNGATVAEALIREGLVRVNELNIVGGDMSLVKQRLPGSGRFGEGEDCLAGDPADGDETTQTEGYCAEPFTHLTGHYPTILIQYRV